MQIFSARTKDIPPGLVIAVLAALGVLLIIRWAWKKYFAMLRAEAMQEVADQMSFQFDPRGEPNILRQYLSLNPIGETSRNWSCNHFKGICQGVEVDVLERGFVFGAGKGAIELQTTFCRVRCPGKRFPAFHLCDMAALNNEVKKIRLPRSVPGFHEGWLLECVDEAAGCTLFEPAQLEGIKSLGVHFLAGLDEWLFFYDPGAPVEPAGIPDFVVRIVAAANTLNTSS